MKKALCRKESVGTPVVFKGHTVITTKLLAQVYEAAEQQIQQNFNNHQEKFLEGKHYFLLQGNELKDFKRQFDDIEVALGVSKFASQLYLWTERGASRHCKILDTDKAWEQFDYLEETYFQIKEQQPMCIEDLIIANAQALKDVRHQVEQATTTAMEAKTTAEQVTQQLESVKDAMLLDHDSWRKDCNNILNKIAKNRGATKEAYKEVREEAYELTEQRAGAKLKQRVINKQDRLRREGGSKSKIDAICKVDVIADDKRLKEIYIAVIKEMAIKYGVV